MSLPTASSTTGAELPFGPLSMRWGRVGLEPEPTL